MPMSPEKQSSPCDWQGRLDSYFDGELTAAQATAAQRHLDACPACRAELEEMRGLSGLFENAFNQPAPRALLVRIHRAVDNTDSDRGTLFRIAGILSGIAASALVIGGAWLFDAPAPRPGVVVVIGSAQPGRENWESLAVNLRSDPLPVTGWEAPSPEALAQARVAEWFLKNL